MIILAKPESKGRFRTIKSLWTKYSKSISGLNEEEKMFLDDEYIFCKYVKSFLKRIDNIRLGIK